jgi:hypothetical protein
MGVKKDFVVEEGEKYQFYKVPRLRSFVLLVRAV